MRGLVFESVDAALPGSAWGSMWGRFWPGYRAWFLRDGAGARPSYLDGRGALEEHMPELVGVYDRLVEVAGGGDLAARMLIGSSAHVGVLRQTRPGSGPLVRLRVQPELFEGVVLWTSWGRGAGVLGLSAGLLA